MVTTFALAKAVLVFTALPEFWIPLGAVALWVAVGFDRRTAILVHVATSFVIASLLRFDLVLLSVFVTRGIAAAVLFFNRKRPRQMLVAGALSGLAGAITYVALIVVLEGKILLAADLIKGLGSNVLACLGGGVLTGLLGTLLRDPAGLALGHISRDKLLDLTDIESPLLQQMAAQAPGSWEHSRAMANLAEAAAAAIGADALLTRVGAYYHDVGKAVQPKYFIENLAPGESSPHDELEPEVSADAIMAHVVLGAKLLREEGVPEPVVEFAYTHHGTQRVEFFWQQYQRQHEDDAEDEPRLTEQHFRYPGMKPMTKETAILMLVDAIEAASRTISPPNRERFTDMIRQVVFGKLSQGQLDESGLTIHDLRLLTDRLASTLVNMYHGRIKYPWQYDQNEPSTDGSPNLSDEPSVPDDSGLLLEQPAHDDETGEQLRHGDDGRSSEPPPEPARESLH